MATTATLPITAQIGPRHIGRDEVLAYENRRIDSAAKKLGVRIPPATDVHKRREALLQTKLELGTDEILRRLRRDTAIASAVVTPAARLTAKRRLSIVDLCTPVGTAASFTDFYQHCVDTDDEAALLRAHPDHFVQRIRADGRHEVVETTGGSPLASHFLIDYTDTSTLVTPADGAFSGQLTGVAWDGSTAVGGVRHQFRDTGSGLHVRLTVEFPWLTPSHMINGHRLHLAVEFSNWIEAAVARAS